jgi:hypothetical protein
LDTHRWRATSGSPPWAPGPRSPGEPDESLVVDARAALTSADVLESKLQYSLHGAAVVGSHVRMGPYRARSV